MTGYQYREALWIESEQAAFTACRQLAAGDPDAARYAVAANTLQDLWRASYLAEVHPIG